MLKTHSIFHLIASCLFALSAPALASGDHAHHHTDNGAGMAQMSSQNNSRIKMETFDHPLARGSLNDEEAQPVLQAFVKEYKRAKADPQRSTIEVFDAYIERLGTRRLTTYFEGRNQSCHGVLHNMGKSVAKLEPNLINAVGVCSDACTYACVHGAMKTIFSEQVESGKKTVQSVQQELVDICAQPPIIPDFYEGNCAHAAGHAFGIIGNERLSPALSLCTVFPNKEMRFYCEGGVYMQLMFNINRALYMPKTTTHRKDRIRLNMNFCYHAGTSMSACMRFVLAKYHKLPDLAIIRGNCDNMNGTARRGCFNGLGYLARSNIMKQKVSIDSMCRGTITDIQDCISGFAFVKKGHASGHKIKAACRAIKDVSKQKFCLDQNSQYLYQVGNPMVEAMY